MGGNRKETGWVSFLFVSWGGMNLKKIIGALCLIVICLGAGFSYGSSAPNASMEHYNKGVQLGQQGKFPEAKKEFEQAVKIDPASVQPKTFLKIIQDMEAKKLEGQAAVHLFKGTTYANKRQFDDAIKELTRSLEISPRYPETYYNRGLIHGMKDRWEQAIADFNRALELNPRYAYAYNDRGKIYLRQGKYDRALSDFNRVTEIEPRDWTGYFHKAIAFENLGRNKEAGEAYKTALQYAPSRPDPQNQQAINISREKIKVLAK